MIKPCEISFATHKLEEEFTNLNEQSELKKQLKRALKEIQKNSFAGIQIPKQLIPKEYIQNYSITNLWKYDLPQGWRLLYSITTPNKVEIVSIILEWFNHKDYERKFKY